MPEFPPLPLIDNHLFIDNSFLEKLNSCPRACQYAYLDRRVAAYSKSALNFGGALHHALAHRYINAPEYVDPITESQQMAMLEEWFTEKPNPAEDHRTLDLAQALIKQYNANYIGEEFLPLTLNGLPAVELPFVFHLFKWKHIDVMYCGRIDLIARLDEMLFVIDHKSTSMMGEQLFKGFSVAPQMQGYCEGVESLLGEKCSGFIVNAIKVPKPTKKDGLKVDSTCFQRGRTYLQDGQLFEWRRNTVSLIEELLWNHERGYMPQKKSWCVNKFGLCEYFSVCELPVDNRALALSTGQYADNIWSPLNDFPKTTINNTTLPDTTLPV